MICTLSVCEDLVMIQISWKWTDRDYYTHVQEQVKIRFTRMMLIAIAADGFAVRWLLKGRKLQMGLFGFCSGTIWYQVDVKTWAFCSGEDSYCMCTRVERCTAKGLITRGVGWLEMKRGSRAVLRTPVVCVCVCQHRLHKYSTDTCKTWYSCKMRLFLRCTQKCRWKKMEWKRR